MLSLEIARAMKDDREREIRELIRVRTLLRDQAMQDADAAERAAKVRRVGRAAHVTPATGAPR